MRKLTLKTATGVQVTFSDPDHKAPAPKPRHTYTVRQCRELSHDPRIDADAIEAHINTLALLVYEDHAQGRPTDDNVCKLIEILEDGLAFRTHDWDSSPTVNIDRLI